MTAAGHANHAGHLEPKPTQKTLNDVSLAKANSLKSKFCLKHVIDSGMRAGSGFFGIWSRLWTPWIPNWAVLWSLGHLLGSRGRLLGFSWAPLGHSWGALGRSWGALGTLLGRSWSDLERSWPLLAVRGRSGLHFQAAILDPLKSNLQTDNIGYLDYLGGTQRPRIARLL